MMKLRKEKKKQKEIKKKEQKLGFFTVYMNSEQNGNYVNLNLLELVVFQTSTQFTFPC